jgi:hypothetical protein
MYGKGFKQRQVWVDEDGFMVGPDSEYGSGNRPRLAYTGFTRELKGLVQPIPDMDKEEVYAELLAYARSLLKNRNIQSGLFTGE